MYTQYNIFIVVVRNTSFLKLKLFPVLVGNRINIIYLNFLKIIQ